MNRAILLLTALSLAGCVTKSTPPVTFPDLPPLSQSIAAPCPPAQRLPEYTDLQTLSTADANLAVLYAACQQRQSAAVEAYERARELMSVAKQSKGQ